jgi:ZIP family zinc transporter
LNWSAIGWGTLAGACTGLATFIGALPVLFARRSSETHQGMMLGFAAGVMLSASYLSLIVPAAAFARAAGYGSLWSAATVALSMLAGAATLAWFSGLRTFERMGVDSSVIADEPGRRAWLLIVAMTSHNVPEGAAVGVGFGAGEAKIAIGTAVGIGIQNLPEGLAVAAALLAAGSKRSTAVLIGGLTGMVEPLGAFLGVALVTMMRTLLPIGMGWAAGAMLFICAAELIPAVHTGEGPKKAVASLILGAGAMLFLDTWLA